MLDKLLQLRETDGPVAGKSLVVELLLDQHADHPECQSSVRPRPKRNPLRPRLAGRLSPARIDRHHTGSTLTRPNDLVVGQGWRVGGRIGSPQDDQLRLLQIGLHPDQHLTHGNVRGNHRKRDVAQGADAEGIGRAEREENAGCGGDGDPGRLEHVTQRHVEAAAPGIDCHGLRAAGCLDLFETRHDGGERLIPRDPLEGMGPFRARCGAADRGDGRDRGRSPESGGRSGTSSREGARPAAPPGPVCPH